MTSPAITWVTLDSAPQALWREFIRSYFDGASHTVGGESIPFPAAEVIFDQSPLPQPVEGIVIAVIAETVRQRSFLAQSGQEVQDEVQWTFYIRADPSLAQSAEGNAKYQSRKAAQLLRALLTSRSITAPLDEKGLRVKTVVQAAPVPATDYLMQFIRATGELHYLAP